MSLDSTYPDRAGNVGSVLSNAGLRLAQTLKLDKSTGRLEARVLASHVWQVPASWLIAHDTDSLTAQQQAQFEALLESRLHGEPIAYITGEREFYGRSFHITPAVLIPRPETELLVDVVLSAIPLHQPLDILELGTGSGCIAISLALGRPQARIVAVEQDNAALLLAQSNARQLGAHIQFLKSNWFRALAEQKFDFIVSNPPYVSNNDPHLGQGDVRFEPLAALTSGPEGMDDLAHIITNAPTFLKSKGGLFLEHGYDQAQRTREWLQKTGFSDTRTWRDLAGHDRLSSGKLSE